MPLVTNNSLRSDAHFGWHWRGEASFFEGWYYRITLPQQRQSFAFMYEVSQRNGEPRSLGAIQVLGKDDRLLFGELSPQGKLTVSYTDLALSYAPLANCHFKLNFVVSDRQHQGQITTHQHHCSWDFSVAVLIPSWGETMGWLSYLPILEPYWQILLPYALAEGKIVWDGEIYSFQDVPLYAEKNWGGSFPKQWFWLQCHSFTDCHEPISLVSAGAVRQVLGWTTRVAMVALWWRGQVYAFLPENSEVWVSVAPWGSWSVQAYSSAYRLEIEAIAYDPPAQVAVPTQRGRDFSCRDTGKGMVEVSLWQGACRLLKVHSELAALETGGDKWQGIWQFCSERI